MQILPIVIKGFTFTLSDSELRAAIANPLTTIVPQMKLALNGGIDAEADVEHLLTAPSKHRPSKKFRNYPKVGGGEKDRKQIARVKCQSCGVLIASYRQGKHKCGNNRGDRASASSAG